MLSVSEIYKKVKEKNLLSGIIIADLIAFISYLIFPSGIFFFGDLHMIIGISIGVYFGLSNKKIEDSEMKTSLVVGILGAFLTAISMSLFEWILRIASYGFLIIDLLFYLTLFVTEALIIGLPISLVFALYFRKKRKNVVIGSKMDERIYKSLEEG
jgi:hypothetical protein